MAKNNGAPNGLAQTNNENKISKKCQILNPKETLITVFFSPFFATAFCLAWGAAGYTKKYYK
jgi:hypothetical protein